MEEMSSFGKQENSEELRKLGINSYKTAFLIIKIGGAIAFLFLLFAKLYLIVGEGHGAGPGFFSSLLLALATFAITSFISMTVSLSGIIRGLVGLTRNSQLKEEIYNQVIKNFILIMFVAFGIIIVYKIIF